MRCKVYSLLLPAYKLLDQEEEFERLYSTLRNMLPLVKAVNSRALLLVTLYGCTNSNLYYRMAHEQQGLVDTAFTRLRYLAKTLNSRLS